MADGGWGNLRCRRGSRCWLRMRGHRLWTQNAPRRNSSPRTAASAAYTRPPQSGAGQEEGNGAHVSAHGKNNNKEQSREELGSELAAGPTCYLVGIHLI